MRYEDASGTFQASGPIANDDADTLSAGQRGPATGNLITGEGTQYGAAGADSAAGAHVTAIAGKGGEDASFSGGKLSVAGEHGRLTVDADGNYSYLANGNVENVRDRFTYTLADNQGNSDTAALIVEIGKTPAVIKADAQQIVPGPDGVVTLPPGVELSDVRVVGRNLVVDLPDGTQLIIIDGAIFVPQLVLGGVEVPATNVAALLIGQEVQPAAGEIPPSGGGNFALPPPPLDPGVPLGDLIPPTVYDYTPPEPQEVLDTLDEEPEIFIQPDGQPASVNAVDSVDEKGLPTRNGGEPEGSGEEAAAGADGDPSEATAGTIIIDSPDGVDSVTINGVLVTGVIGQEIAGDFGTLTITGFDGDNILYSYVLNDNTSGNDTQDDFEVILTDDDGDTATATLTIDIIDDVPTARPDTDAIAAGQFGPVTGNVITDASAGDAGDGDSGADTVGADDAELTSVTGAGSTTPIEGGFTVNGQYGVLTINIDGSYSYVRNPGTPGGVNDVFNYTLTDGDGDTSTTTLTISIADTPPTIDVPVAGEDGTEVNEKGLPTRNGEPAGSGEIADGNGADNDDGSETTSGVVNFTPGDGPATITIDGVAVTSVGQTFNGDHGVLTITAIGANSVSYSYTLTDNTSGDATSDSFAFSVTDQDGDAASGNLVIDIVDDVPTAVNDTDLVPAGTFGPATGNVITDASAGDAGDGDNGADTVGADNAAVTGLASNNVPANVDNDAAGGFVVNGQYGVLTMQADGSYSYVRNPGSPGGVDDVFTYTLTDGDGDTDTATLTISIADSPVTLDAPDQGEAGTVVDEKGLPTRNGGEPAGSGESADGNGADNDDTSETTAGTITYTAPDGPATITVDGVAVTSVGQTFVGTFGTLTVTSIAGGSIGYSYTLADNTSGDATSDDFAIAVTDADGDVANDTLVIDIIDDVPTAVDDTDSITSGGTTATGNVITDASAGDAGDSDNGADTVGADNASVSGVASNNVPANSDNDPAGGFVVVGQYGTLTMQADGSYSYARADGTPGNVQDVFTYTLTDGDGDSDTATLTISIEDAAPNLPDPAAVLLDDDALAGGNAGGTGDDVNSQGTPGQLVGSGGDGDLDYAFTGVNGLPAGFTVNVVNAGQIQILQGATVVLTVTLNNDTGAYTVVQNNPIDHPAGSNENNVQFSIGVEVEDADGDSEPATITINVDDDTPVAVNDTDSITSGGNTATGNVITDASAGDAGDSDNGADSVGADGGAAIVGLASNNVPANVDNNPAGGFVVVGQFGTLTMQADGSYSYLRADGSPGNAQDVFTYTLTDADGDTTTATLTIGIEDAAPNLPDPAAVLLDDDALAGGNAGGTGDDVNSQGTPGQLVGSGGDGDLDYAFTGVNGLPAGFTVNVVNAGQIQILQGATVVLTVTLDTETGAYSVVQNNQIDHPEGLNENNLSFTVGVQVVDADGDSEPATITINVDDDTPVAANDTDSIPGGSNGPATGNVITDAAAGDAGDSDTGADSVGADGGAAIVGLASNNVPANVDNDVAGGFVVDGEFGTLTMQADGSYSYLRNDGEGAGENEVFTYTLTDADGDTTTATLTISIANATPTLPDPAAVLLDDDALAGGNAGGTGDDVNSQGTPGQLVGSGGDGDLDYNFTGLNTLPAGFSVNVVNDGQIQVLQGATVVLTVTLNNDTGSFNVVQNNPIDHPAGSNENNLSFSIGVEVEDADGDAEPATITINVDDDTPVVSANAAVQLDDESLAGGIAGGTGDVNPNTANTSGTLGHSFGADGAGSVAYLTSGAPAGFTYELSGNDLLIKQGATTVITATVNPTTGAYTITQNAPIQHPAGANENDVSFTINYRVTDADGDTVDGSLTINSDDDTPTATVNGQAALDQLVLDETRPLGQETDGDSNPVGIGSVQANFADNFVAPIAYGADGPGSTAYSLVLSANGIGSGLYALDPTDTETAIDGFGRGAEITLSQVGNVITGSAGGLDYFTITINPATGEVTFAQIRNVWHANTGNDDDTSSLTTAAAANIQVVQTVTDSDGDSASASINVGQGVFHIEDDGPEFGNVDAVLNIENDADPSGTGDLVIDLGSDGPSSNNNVISVSNFNVSVNGVPLDPADFSLTPGVENATTASYTFSFSYDTGSGGTATANGTLVFDKVAGTYTVDLDGPIEGFSILQTATGTLFQGYEFGTSTPDGSQPAISVTQIQGTPGDPDPSDLFVQFTSVAEPSSGTGDNNLELTSWVPGANNPPPVNGGGDTSFNGGDLFNQTDSWVSTSNTANGVAGDTIQGGEVLDFTLVQGANPTGVLADESTYGQASSMFLKFDGIGSGEDMIVVLKLYDPNTDTYTTRAVMIQNADIQKGPGTGPGVYSSISLDNNDGLVIIESNDYNLPGENWVIVGAQIAGSDEGVTGTAINLNSAIGAAGDSDADNNGSLDTQAFSTDTNDGPFKISSIGFITESTSDQSATLDFDVTITEADGDSETQAITVNIGDPPAALAASESSFQTQSVSKTAANDDYSSLLAGDSVQKSYFNGTGFGHVGNTGITSAMVAASGLGMVSSSLQGFNDPSSSHLAQNDYQSLSIQAAGREGMDEGLASISFGGELGGSAVNAVNLSSSGFSFNDHGFGGRGIDAMSFGDAEPAYVPSYASGEPTVANVAALAANVPAVSMASAEMLRAAGLDGNVQHGGSVEQVLADALGNNAPTIDGILANLPGGIAELSAIANLASPDGTGVPAWDMGMQGGFAPSHDVMFKVEAAMIHQDAIQPA